MASPILTIKDLCLSFGERTLFEHVDLAIYPGEKIAIIGRNGEGKSTLLKVIAHVHEPDKGTTWTPPGLKIGYLPQNLDYQANQTTYDYLISAFTENAENMEYQIDIIAEPLQIDRKKKLSELSGGELRRVHLAKALLDQPDILMLDEPTNHLDITTIEWLESYIHSYKGAVCIISHDRTFLANVSQKMLWIDRAAIHVSKKGYKHFESWSLELLEQEKRELDKLRRKMTEEELWRHQGVTGRRKRNQRRLSELYDLRERMRSAKESLKQKSLEIETHDFGAMQKSKLLAEIEDVTVHIQDKPIIKNFTCTITKGDKLGIVGSNGCGKSTLLKLLTGDLEPYEGRIKLAKNITISYYDQHRITLNPQDTLWETLCPNGGDHVKVGDDMLHVVTYLKRFMFDPKVAKDLVATLSGGQANRLMLAKLLASPGSLLILDEPTNDLDMDTLDMLQELLWNYTGTLIIVSHDRDFLDKLVSKTLIFEGNGKITEYFGSYLEYRKHLSKPLIKPTKQKVAAIPQVVQASAPDKISYKFKRELELIPKEIDALEQDIASLENQLADDALYTSDPELFAAITNKLSNNNHKLEKLWQRWSELDDM